MSKTHYLKCINPYFQDAFDGKKKFEVRLNDRDFNVCDEIILQEYDAENREYMKRELRCEIIYILDNPDFCKKGYVIIGFRVCQVKVKS